jgi:hypothetical protein
MALLYGLTMAKRGRNALGVIRVENLVLEEGNWKLLTAINCFLDIWYDRGVETHGGYWEQLFELGADDEGVL